MRIFALALISLGLPAFALDPAMLNLVSPNATALIGLDVTRIQASPFGQYLMREVGRQAGDLDKIAAATGFDPRRDLREVLVASSGPATKQGLIIARGAFDQQRLSNLATAAGFVSSGYKGVTILMPAQNRDVEAAAFVAGYLIAGSRSEVEGAIDRSSARGAAGALESRALLASTRYDAWVVTSMPADLAQSLPGGASGPNLPLRGINSVLGGVQFGSQVDIGVEAEARSVQDATSLADVIRLVVALGQSNNGAAEFATLLNSLTITTEGNVVKAGLKVAQADLERLINNSRSGRVRRVAQR